MGPAKLRKYVHHLQCLKVVSPATNKAIIKSADKGLLNCLCEEGLNVLKGNVAFTASQKRRLSRRKADLRKIGKRGFSIQGKKRILQKGGFLGALLAPLAGIVSRYVLPAVAAGVLGGAAK